MTEAQMRAFPALRALPIYDEHERANSITSGRGQHVRECPTVQEVEDCLKDSRLVPLGGLRVGVDGPPVVVVYFAERM
ncbi:MAG TPA: hypothetical protein VKE74_00515 [Gemmataceae bacterium]|nr:hypothetical protein [Gemmataceae bacterium]